MTSEDVVFVAQPCMLIAPPHQPCMFIELPPGLRFLNGWIGGPACAQLGAPRGKKPPPREPLPLPHVIAKAISGPYALVLGEISLTASGAVSGAILGNGTFGAARSHLYRCADDG